MFCTNCGANISDNAMFCSKCGAPVIKPGENSLKTEWNPEGLEKVSERVEEQIDTAMSDARAREAKEALQMSQDPNNKENSTADLVFKVISGVVGIVFLYYGFRNALGILTGLFNGYGLSGKLGIMLMSGIGAVANIIVAALFLIFGFRRKPTQTAELFCAAACSPVIYLALNIARFIICSVFGFRLNIFTWQLAWAILGVVALFVSIVAFGMKPFGSLNLSEPKEAFADIFNAVLEAVTPTAEEQAKIDKMNQERELRAANQAAAQNAATVQRLDGDFTGTKYQMTTNRGIFKYIIFSLLTCGIYGLWFIYSMARDVNELCSDDGEKTGGLIAFILLSFITCGIYSIVWQYKMANRLAENAPRYGLNFQENGTTVLLWILLGWLICGLGPLFAINILIKNTNRLAKVYNKMYGFEA